MIAFLFAAALSSILDGKTIPKGWAEPPRPNACVLVGGDGLLRNGSCDDPAAMCVNADPKTGYLVTKPTGCYYALPRIGLRPRR